MKLLSVSSKTATASEGTFELQVTADLEDGNGEQRLPYGWAPGDPHGLGPQIDAFMEENPNFPVQPYVPVPMPEVSDQDLVSQFKELAAKLKERGLV